MAYILRFGVLAACGVALSACWGSFMETPEADRVCPPATIQHAMQSQRLLAQVQDGVTTTKALRAAGDPLKKATLIKTGEEPLQLWLYRTGVAGCKWLLAEHLAEPVVLRDGIVIAHGAESFSAMTAKGWRIKEAQWPWQKYDFGYIPYR